jgi:hypothetical protein
MNNIAITPQIFMTALQNQNVERKIAKKIDIPFKKEQSIHTSQLDELTNSLDISNKNTNNNVFEQSLEPIDNGNNNFKINEEFVKDSTLLENISSSY